MIKISSPSTKACVISDTSWRVLPSTSRLTSSHWNMPSLNPTMHDPPDHISAIVKFGCTIQYIPGWKSPTANALPCIHLNTAHSGINYEELASLHKRDPEMNDYRNAITSLKSEDRPLVEDRCTIVCNVSTRHPCQLVLPAHSRHAFDLLHDLSHSSGCKTSKIICQKFICTDSILESIVGQDNAWHCRQTK